MSFPDYRGFPVPAKKKGLQIWNLHPNKHLLKKENNVFFNQVLQGALPRQYTGASTVSKKS